MFCRKCGNQVADNDKFCSNCGTQLSLGKPQGERTANPDDAADAPKVGNQDGSGKSSFNYEGASAGGAPAVWEMFAPEAPVKSSGKAIAGFVLSIIGIIVLAIPCGIIGLILSALSFRETSDGSRRGRGLAIAGFVISIVDIVMGLVYLLDLLAMLSLLLS